MDEIQEILDRLYTSWYEIQKTYDDFARSNDMTPNEYLVYWAVSELGEGATLTAIAEWANLPKQTVSSVIDRAKTDGLLETHANPKDARGKIVAFTEEGQASLGVVNKRREAAEELAVHGISLEQAEACIDVMRRFDSQLRSALGLGVRHED